MTIDGPFGTCSTHCNECGIEVNDDVCAEHPSADLVTIFTPDPVKRAAIRAELAHHEANHSVHNWRCPYCGWPGPSLPLVCPLHSSDEAVRTEES